MIKALYTFLISFVLVSALSVTAAAGEGPAAKSGDFYEIRVYHLATNEQVALVERFLQGALLPALHKADIKSVGVFKPVGNDTAAAKKIVVFVPYKSMEQMDKVTRKLQKDNALAAAAAEYLNVSYQKPAFTRYETILLQAFENMPRYNVPQLKSPKGDRVYELRSYEGHSEKIYQNKVEMFNKGGEIALFNRLGFNAVFYGDVIAGCRMPNLMYMTTFENMDERNKHWKTFSNDPEWKQLSTRPEYQNNVSKIDVTLLTPTAYSDL